ncbi:glutamine synthetase family protein [Ktedonobacter racemifer]|uniref:glutamine synthetase n=1 Tax=Ktedonobacter racemifer DSM 44963 TaxID=485913 RepID=D6TTB9_KTERA|nr:glutamine synthetase family protein [Ktedonobacter racemifer]EFH83670.1 Glutamate--ammonia ligase [Ktedonobacter racemifer DSM 44963]
MSVHESLSTPVQRILKSWKEAQVELVHWEIPDLAGMPRAKTLSLPYTEALFSANDKASSNEQHGLHMIGVLGTVDSGSNLVPETYHSEERAYSDAVLLPDLSTATLVPWLDQTARVICDPCWPDGTPLTAAPRLVLKQVLRQLEQQGYTARVALEHEFYLLHDLRDLTTLRPVFEGLHIFHTERNLAVPVLPALMRHLKAMGLEMRTCNAEYGTGQYELTFGEQEGVIAADHAYTFKQAVKAIAKQLGYHASFMTKPFPDQSASGAHAHISLWDAQGQNIFLDQDNPHGLSQLACYAIAGMLAHAPAAAALLSPTPNCWSRFQYHSFAPVNLSWGLDDRTALVRAKNSRGQGTHLENRLPSALANPYLTIATVAACILLGIREAKEPHPLIEGPAEESEEISALPKSLHEALDALERDTALREILGVEFTDIYLKVKRQELQRQEEYVRQQADLAALAWQRQEYLADY